MDGDSSHKTMTAGASAATRATDLTDGIHEDAKKDLGGAPAGEKTTGTGTSVFDKGGAVGSAFKSDGAIGGTAEKVGGPFSSSGAVGKQFTEQGGIGGSVQSMLGQGEKNTFQGENK
ncbi:hypothetical protein MBLNU230_g0720t1 [Neophaeotheca triangularis]